MKNQDKDLLHSIVRLRYNSMGLIATFKEGITVLVAIGSAALAAIRNNE